jgi:hypothetical protein
MQFKVVHGNKTFYFQTLVFNRKNDVQVILVEDPNFILRIKHNFGANERQIIDRPGLTDKLKIEYLFRNTYDYFLVLGIPNNNLVSFVVEVQELIEVWRK